MSTIYHDPYIPHSGAIAHNSKPLVPVQGCHKLLPRLPSANRPVPHFVKRQDYAYTMYVVHTINHTRNTIYPYPEYHIYTVNELVYHKPMHTMYPAGNAPIEAIYRVPYSWYHSSIYQVPHTIPCTWYTVYDNTIFEKIKKN